MIIFIYTGHQHIIGSPLDLLLMNVGGEIKYVGCL